MLAEESGWTKAGTEAKAVLAVEKAESISGDQEKALRYPLRVSVKGRRSRVSPQMYFL